MEKKKIILQKTKSVVEANWMHRDFGKSYSILWAESVGVFCRRGNYVVR